MTDRKKPGVAFWATVVVVLLLYPLSFGPACWLASRTDTGKNAVFKTVYWPLGWLVYQDIPVVGYMLGAYACAGMPEEGFCELPAGGSLFRPRSTTL
jgi:hypothetical protein